MFFHESQLFLRGYSPNPSLDQCCRNPWRKYHRVEELGALTSVKKKEYWWWIYDVRKMERKKKLQCKLWTLWGRWTSWCIYNVSITRPWYIVSKFDIHLLKILTSFVKRFKTNNLQGMVPPRATWFLPKNFPQYNFETKRKKKKNCHQSYEIYNLFIF